MKHKNILVTGGAGYIGSVCVKKLIELGHNVIIIDNLSKGLRRLVNDKAIFYELDLKNNISKVFKNNYIDAVIHFAGYKAVGESMINPKKYYDNILGTKNLLNNMTKFGVKKIIFSSSAAVYGIPEYVPIDEKHKLNAINYYGETKIKCEKLIREYNETKDIRYINLRYFNVIGDGGLDYLDPAPENILPIIMEAVIGKRQELKIFGNDYKTKDGTCVRDYIDVNDLVDAHIVALDIDESASINLGTGTGVSVTELVCKTINTLSSNFKYTYVERREGDPAVLTASNKLAKEILNWSPKIPLEESIRSTFKAYIK